LGGEIDEKHEKERTPKGEKARQRLLESALQLFGSRGYEETTMRDIAAEAGYSPGLTYRYFSSKEELVLSLYRTLCAELEEYAQTLPRVSLPERMYAMIARQLELMAPYREALSALFGTALNSHANTGVFSEGTADIRRHSRQIYRGIVQTAKDAPKESQHENLATLLYGMHLAMVLFWLIDESQQTWRSRLFLAFLRDMLKLTLPLLWLPPLSQALARLVTIVGPLLGDDRQRAAPPQE
jgi:AcrR family transcriptional regulator